MRRNLFGALLCAVLVAGLVALVPGTADAGSAHAKPGIPTGLSVVSADTALVVSWSAPTYTGTSAIQGYVTSVHAFHTHATCVPTGPTSCLVSGIPNRRSAVIRVRAYNGAGAGPSTFVDGIPGTAVNCAYVGPYANLQGCNFAFTPLPSLNLTGANLTGTDLEDVSLTGATLTGAILTGADLQYIASGSIVGTPAALPTGWALGGGFLMGPGVGLDYANLSGITFPAADLTGANLQGATLTGATLTAVTSFNTTDLEYANLAGADIQGAKLTGADLAHVGSGGLTGTPASLPAGWGVAGGYLVGPDAALSWGTVLDGATFPAADLTGADLEGASVKNAVLSSVTSLENASLAYTNLTGSDLTGVDLTGADLTGANLTGANLTGANLTGANLTGADFSTATVTGVVWSNTTCPDGSNSDTDGFTCVGFGI